METLQKMVKIIITTDVKIDIINFICNGRPVFIKSKVQEKTCNFLYKMCVEVHLS